MIISEKNKGSVLSDPKTKCGIEKSDKTLSYSKDRKSGDNFFVSGLPTKNIDLLARKDVIDELIEYCEGE